MAGSDIRAGRAFVEMFVKDSALVKGLNSAQAKLKAFGNAVKAIGLGLTGIGAGILAPILGSAKQFAETGDALDKMSQRTGISVEKLSELSAAAMLAGTTVEEIETPIRKMQKAIVEASEGSSAAAIAIQSLGLNAEALRHMKPDEQFQAIAEKLMQIQDPALRAADAMKIFGKSGTSILPVIENMKEASARAYALGALMSKEDVAAAVKLEASYRDLKLALSGIANAIGSSVAPVLTTLLNQISLAVAAVSNWIRQNKTLVVVALTVGTAILAAGAAFLAVGYTFIAFGTAFGAISAVITSGAALIGAAWGIMTAIVTTGIFAMATAFGIFAAIIEIAVGAPLLVFAAIIGILIASVATFVIFIQRLKEGVVTAFQNMASAAATLFTAFKNTFLSIKDAIEAGDIDLAFKVMMAGIKVTWLTGLAEMKAAWENFKINNNPLGTGGFGNVPAQAPVGGSAVGGPLNSGNAELDKATQELQDLRDRAAKERTDAIKENSQKLNPSDIGEAIKAHSAGVFNAGSASTLSEIGGSNTAEKIEENTKKTVTALAGILKELKHDNSGGTVQIA